MILLSSYGLCTPIIAQKARKYLNPENTKVLMIPFAGFDNKSTADRELNNGLLTFGFKPENIYICDLVEPNSHKDKKIDLIYVPGGNPFKLLKEASDIGILQWLRELVNQGADYFGVSSGADFACENIEYLKLVEDCDYELESYDSLGLLKEKVLCHIDQRDMGTLQKIKECDNLKTIFLRNNELYIIYGIGNEKKYDK